MKNETEQYHEPLVSVLMPVKNEEEYIDIAIKSILNQTYKNFELIIINDNSTDNTSKILSNYSNEEKIVIINAEKYGKNNAFNQAYKKSKGKYICYFAGDDVLEFDSLENRISPIINNSNDLVATVSRLRTISIYNKFNNVITPRNEKKGTFIGGTLFFTRLLAERIFPLPEILPNEDKWTVLHLENFSKKIFHVPKITINYRIHEKNSSSRTGSFKRKNENMHKRFVVYSLFLEKYKKILSAESIKKISALCSAENYRFKGNNLAILFLPNLCFREKIRFIFHSNKFFYWIRIQLFSFFSGR